VQGKISHPISDPTLPSFVHPALADANAELELVSNCWELLRAGKEKHLPKEPKEPKTAYQARLLRSSYPSFYKDAIVAYAGALSRFELRDAPALLQKHQSSVDGDGNSLKAFWMVADALTLRDGGCLLTVDMPPGRAASRADDIATGRRPYLARVERRNVVNWRTARENGREVCTAVCILEWTEVEDGEFGTKLEPRYRLMRGGDWQLIELVQSGDGWRPQVVIGPDGERMEGTFNGPGDRPLSRPPVIWYSGGRAGFGRGMPTLLSLAQLTLDWFREYSDLKELLHRTAMPVPVRKGMIGAGPGGSTPPMILGPNSGIDLPAGGEFNFAEVAGGSLAQHVEHLKHIETLIDRQTLSFLFSGDAQKTATQSMLEAAQLQATLSSLAEGKSSAMESVFQLWGQFTGETVAPGAGINLDSGVFDQPVGVEQVRLVRELYNDGLMTRASAVQLIGKAHLLPPDQTPDKEVAQLEAEEPLPAETPGVDDLADGMPG
jgi:hypothetical protein